MKKLEELTEEQQELMLKVRDEYIDLALNSGKQVTENEIREGIDWLYKFSKIKDVHPHICICESPMAMQFAINIMNQDGFWKELNINKKGILGNSVGNSVWNSVRNSVWNSVGNSVWNSVENSVRNSVGNSVRNIPPYKLKHFINYTGLSWESWISFYDYFTRINMIKNKDFDTYLELIKKGIWQACFFEHIVFICTLPTKILKDQNGQLHSITEPAAQWINGESYYFIHGVEFKKELWLKLHNKELTPEEAIKLENIEQRTVALQEIGYSIVMQRLGAKVIDTHTEHIDEGSAWSWVLNLKGLNYEKKIEYQLIEMDLKDHEKAARFIKVQWFTKDGYLKETLLRVAPDCATASQALGWTFNDEAYENAAES